MVTKTQLLQAIRNYKNGRSVWAKAVKEDAICLISENISKHNKHLALSNTTLLEKALLNGAENWGQYSWGGCGLVYDCDIARHYSNNTELKITKNGNRRPNKQEEWLDVQARALYQACELIKQVFWQIQEASK